MNSDRRFGSPAVTIFSDASLDPRVRVGGWGAWIKSSRKGSMTAGGSFKREARTSHEAETMGIANAIVAAARHGYFRSGDAVMIQCDSLEALGIVMKAFDAEDRPSPGGHLVQRRRRKLHPTHVEAVDVIRGVVAPLDLKLILRHVKGHKAGDGRQWVNREVDRIARGGMAKARRALAASCGNL